MSTKLPKPTQTILKQNHSKIEELANNPVYKLTDIEKIIGVERHSLANYIKAHHINYVYKKTQVKKEQVKSKVIEMALDDNFSKDDIINQLGVSPNLIKEILSENHIKFVKKKKVASSPLYAHLDEIISLSKNPETTIQTLAEHFQFPENRVRYFIEKNNIELTHPTNLSQLNDFKDSLIEDARKKNFIHLETLSKKYNTDELTIHQFLRSKGVIYENQPLTKLKLLESHKEEVISDLINPSITQKDILMKYHVANLFLLEFKRKYQVKEVFPRTLDINFKDNTDLINDIIYGDIKKVDICKKYNLEIRQLNKFIKVNQLYRKKKKHNTLKYLEENRIVLNQELLSKSVTTKYILKKYNVTQTTLEKYCKQNNIKLQRVNKINPNSFKHFDKEIKPMLLNPELSVRQIAESLNTTKKEIEAYLRYNKMNNVYSPRTQKTYLIENKAKIISLFKEYDYNISKLSRFLKFDPSILSTFLKEEKIISSVPKLRITQEIWKRTVIFNKEKKDIYIQTPFNMYPGIERRNNSYKVNVYFDKSMKTKTFTTYEKAVAYKQKHENRPRMIINFQEIILKDNFTIVEFLKIGLNPKVLVINPSGEYKIIKWDKNIEIKGIKTDEK